MVGTDYRGMMSDDDGQRPPKGPPEDKGKRGRPPLKLVHSDATALHDNHRADLESSGLNEESIKLGGFYTEVRPSAIGKILGRTPRAVDKLGSCMVIPYRSPGASEAHTARVKPTHPRRVKAKDGTTKEHVVKYDQATQDGVLIYWTARALRDGLYADRSKSLVITEGEKKAALLDQLGYAVIGLGGVWNWTDKGVDEKDTGRMLHPDIREHCALKGRDIAIIFDADASSNDDVLLAARQLAGCLLAQGAGRVRFSHPPDAASKQGIDDYFVAEGEEATRTLVDSAPEIDKPVSPKEPFPLITDYRALRFSPVKRGLRIPLGFNVRKDGSLWQCNPDPEKPDKQVALGAMLIGGYQRDLDTGEHRVEVVFSRRGKWHTAVVDARAVVDKSPMLAELAPHLAPVTGNNAVGVIDWFAAYKQANEDLLPEAVSVRRLGWVELNGAPAFVLNEPLAKGGPVRGVVVDSRGENRKIIKALTPQGSYSAHIEALKKAWEASPTCALMICASLAPPLLELLGAPNFGVHLWGDSSKGKSSMASVAGSVWGDPDPGGSWISSWSASWVGAELRAAMLSGLPLCFDEVGATDMRTLERMVYMIVNGGGRTRGNKDLSVREVMSWRTVLLSNGELQLAGEMTATGAQIRIIQQRVTDFGLLTAAEIEALRNACAEHRGQAGRKWIQAILDTDRDRWPQYQQQLREWIAKIRERCGGNTLMQRQATYFGLLVVVEMLAHQALGLGKADGSTMFGLALADDNRQDVRPLHERARDLVESWLASAPATFPTMGRGYDGEAEAGDSAARERLVNGYHRGDGAVVFVPEQIKGKLRDAGINADEVLRGWRERGWLECDANDKRHTKAVRGIPGQPEKRPRMIIVRFPNEDE